MSRKLLPALAVALIALLFPLRPQAFCGFYVAKADSSLYNEASQVVIARDGERTVLTMSNDFQGDLKEFAIVVPVPVVLQQEQIHVGEKAIIDRLDAFSAPRLVEYFDEDPCNMRLAEMVDRSALPMPASAAPSPARAKSLGVTIEASYTVGEYDILILSAKESDGLETWLIENGYRMPKGASAALQPYIRQGLKFFVAKVNLKEQAKTGFTYLRPLQMAFESPRFMLPIRLGMVNAKGAQDLLIYVLTRRGRVETTNYRTARIPSDMELPPYVKGEFASFYRDMFATAHAKEGRNVVFLEHFWDMGWCDPCAADPLSQEELEKAGVFWLGEGVVDGGVPGIAPPMPRRPKGGGAQDVLITRLHARYDNEHFPEDLAFKETEDRQNFQGRYVLRHPYKGTINCDEGRGYLAQLRERQEKECQQLATLTGWDIGEIRGKAGVGSQAQPITSKPATTPPPPPTEPWWRRIWR